MMIWNVKHTFADSYIRHTDGKIISKKKQCRLNDSLKSRMRYSGTFSAFLLFWNIKKDGISVYLLFMMFYDCKRSPKFRL